MILTSATFAGITEDKLENKMNRFGDPDTQSDASILWSLLFLLIKLFYKVK